MEQRFVGQAPVIEGREGDYIQTFSGRQFWPLSPRPEDIYIHDVAHALSFICRFGGHTSQFYPVSNHCLLVSSILREWEKLKIFSLMGLCMTVQKAI